MGYTHHWTRKSAEIPLEKWNQICNVMRPILSTAKIVDLEITEQFIIFNGEYETFLLQRVEEATPSYMGGVHFFSFCKTERYQYDQFVVACLLVADKILKGDSVGFNWSSDGDAEDHQLGLELVKDFVSA